MLCTDLHCKQSSHCQERDDLLLDILDLLVKTSHNSLPTYGGRWVGGKDRMQGRPIPGWKEDVEPLRQESMYWGDVWKKEGRPNTGWLHDTYIKKKYKYHYAVRRAKARSNQNKAENLLAAALQGDTALLCEMKKIRKGGGGPAELPDTVAGANGEQEIVEKFRLVYSGLYNSCSTKPEMATLQEKVDSLIRPESLDQVAVITGAIVKDAVCSLKPRKTDVSSWFSSDALLNAPDILFEQLAFIFRSWVSHGNITPSMLACSFLPLLKSSLKDPSDTGSYRAIAGSSLILKVFEKVILLLWGHLLSSDSLQFGFKARTSTEMSVKTSILNPQTKSGTHKNINQITDINYTFSFFSSILRLFSFLSNNRSGSLPLPCLENLHQVPSRSSLLSHTIS